MWLRAGREQRAILEAQPVRRAQLEGMSMRLTLDRLILGLEFSFTVACFAYALRFTWYAFSHQWSGPEAIFFSCALSYAGCTNLKRIKRGRSSRAQGPQGPQDDRGDKRDPPLR